jgi:chromosome partitioning protein
MVTGSDPRLGRVIAVINGKGGVGKTSLTANMGGELAAAGLKVLLVDTDLSGNLGLDLGYIDDPANDSGKAIVQAVWGGGDLLVLRNVRPNLDVVPGGRNLALVSKISTDSAVAADLAGGGVGPAFADVLAAIAPDYDVVIIDCAPGNPELQQMALTAARYVLIPTRTDPGGWDGLRAVGPQVKAVRKVNPQLTYLGVVVFAHSANATRVMKGTRAHLDEVADTVRLLDTFIRHSATAAHDCRVRGQLAREVGQDASRLAQERVAALREQQRIRRTAGQSDGAKLITLPTALSGTADDVAGDYERLAREVLQFIAASENDTPAEAVR